MQIKYQQAWLRFIKSNLKQVLNTQTRRCFKTGKRKSQIKDVCGFCYKDKKRTVWKIIHRLKKHCLINGGYHWAFISKGKFHSYSVAITSFTITIQQLLCLFLKLVFGPIFSSELENHQSNKLVSSTQFILYFKEA